MLSVALGLALCEVGLRLYLPPQADTAEIYEPHSRYLFLLNPNGRGAFKVLTSKSESTSIEIKLSSLGLRDREYRPKEPDEYRIAMLGDSFTLGYATRAGDTIPSQLERLFEERNPQQRTSVINAGCSAAGPWQELGMLEERVLALQPDLVILQLFPNNDIDNSLTVIGKRLRAYDVESHQFLYNFFQQNRFPFWLDRFALHHCRTYSELCGLLGHRNLLSVFVQNLRLCPSFELEALPPSEDRPFWTEVNLANWYPELEDGFSLFCRDVGMIRDTCRERGVDLVVYTVPNLHEIEAHTQKWFLREVNGERLYEPLKAVNRTETFLREEGIPFFSVVEILRNAPDIDKVYYRFDGHLTPLGNRLVAERIHQYLTSEYRGADTITRAPQMLSSKAAQ